MNIIKKKWFDVFKLVGKTAEFDQLTNINLSRLGKPFSDLKKWSNLEVGFRDVSLHKKKGLPYSGFISWVAKCLFWKKYIILMPIGDPDTPFVAGYYSQALGQCKVSSQRRRIKDGPFAMRMGPNNCGFFAVSHSYFEPIKLRCCGYIQRDLDLL